VDNFFPMLLFIPVGATVGAAPIALGSAVSGLLDVHRPHNEKLSPYKCGFYALEDARMEFNVRYYLVAIPFILFDLEIAFLFPWAIGLREHWLVRLQCNGGLSLDPGHRLHLRTEKRRAGMGLIAFSVVRRK